MFVDEVNVQTPLLSSFGIKGKVNLCVIVIVFVDGIDDATDHKRVSYSLHGCCCYVPRMHGAVSTGVQKSSLKAMGTAP